MTNSWIALHSIIILTSLSSNLINQQLTRNFYFIIFDEIIFLLVWFINTGKAVPMEEKTSFTLKTFYSMFRL